MNNKTFDELMRRVEEKEQELRESGHVIDDGGHKVIIKSITKSYISEEEGKFRLANLRGKKVKWNDVYESEEELVQALKDIIPGSQYHLSSIPAYKGYDYINSFSLWVQTGKELTPNQMRQAKRNACEIKKAQILGLGFREIAKF